MYQYQLLLTVDDHARLHFDVEFDTVDCTIGKMEGIDNARGSDSRRVVLLADILIHLYIEVVRIHLSEVNSSPFAHAFAVVSVVALGIADAVASERGTRYCSHVLG